MGTGGSVLVLTDGTTVSLGAALDFAWLRDDVEALYAALDAECAAEVGAAAALGDPLEPLDGGVAPDA